MKSATSVFLILIVFIFSSCDKESAGHPHLQGSWQSTTTDLTLTFMNGRFEAVHDLPSHPGYLIYKGNYTLDGSNIYLTAEQAEGFDDRNMAAPITVIYERTVAEHFKFKISGETVELTRANKEMGVMLINDGIYAKKF